MTGWLRAHQRRKILERPFPGTWTGVLEQNVTHWRYLDEGERDQLRRLVQVFVAEKHWEGCGGLELTNEIRVTIAALACLLVLGMEHDLYGNVQSILVYRSTVFAPGGHLAISSGLALEGPRVAISGQAMLAGPVLLVWDAVRHDAVHPERGHNVVYHEFAHKLDMLDGWIDGTPPLSGREEHARWVLVCTREYEELRRRRDRGQAGLLDTYGGTNPGEFFAVVTEYFFDQPLQMKRRHEQLYRVLQDFYHQDPAAREARHASRQADPRSPDR